MRTAPPDSQIDPNDPPNDAGNRIDCVSEFQKEWLDILTCFEWDNTERAVILKAMQDFVQAVSPVMLLATAREHEEDIAYAESRNVS